MRKEYVFMAALAVIAALLFGFGSRGAVAVQQALRGPMPGAEEFAASISGIFAGSAGAAGTVSGKTVAVFSQYPLNLKHELVIAAGSGDGIVSGDIALAEGFFVGVVTKTAPHSATVQTIFDSRFQAPVRLGAAGTDALLKGGNNPTLTLIPADAAAGENDQVYSASAGVPYGTPIGVLRSIHDANDKVFREASLAAPYNPGTLEKVTIVPSSKP
jgi:cell shape-determining protein MreC